MNNLSEGIIGLAIGDSLGVLNEIIIKIDTNKKHSLLFFILHSLHFYKITSKK